MNPDTGRIYDEEELKKLGRRELRHLTPIDQESAGSFAAMPRKQRRAAMAAHRRELKRAAKAKAP